ncbi:MAG: hypothetical protein LUD72_04110 [Bacteroidales bacterium]|nr:hypothetical protein [Bacteroidales bacterium]
MSDIRIELERLDDDTIGELRERYLPLYIGIGDGVPTFDGRITSVHELKRFYGAKSWFVYPMFYDPSTKGISESTHDCCNSYIVVSKRSIRRSYKNALRMKTTDIKLMADKEKEMFWDVLREILLDRRCKVIYRRGSKRRILRFISYANVWQFTETLKSSLGIRDFDLERDIACAVQDFAVKSKI